MYYQKQMRASCFQLNSPSSRKQDLLESGKCRGKEKARARYWSRGNIERIQNHLQFSVFKTIAISWHWPFMPHTPVEKS